MKKIISFISVASMMAMMLALPVANVGAIAPPNWNVMGTYQWLVSGTYAHDMVITSQAPDGTFSGTGGYPAGGPYTQTEVITGQVSGDGITFTTTYSPGPYSVTVNGTIAPDGAMSGTDPFEWHTTSGNAVALVLAANVTTNPATAVTSSDATLNGTNGSSAAVGHSFWVSLAPFSTASPTIPAGVYSTPDLGAIAANTSFSASLSSVTTTGVPGNLPAVTANTTYYFVAWSLVDGTWYPGQILTFTTASTTPPVTPPTNKDHDDDRNNNEQPGKHDDDHGSLENHGKNQDNKDHHQQQNHDSHNNDHNNNGSHN